MEGIDLDFRSELGRYFVCECKDWKAAADFTSFAKFCRVLDSTKAKFGIIFTRSGMSGKGQRINAEAEQIKVFQDRGMVIITIDLADLDIRKPKGSRAPATSAKRAPRRHNLRKK
jgi:hypothetical protein